MERVADAAIFTVRCIVEQQNDGLRNIRICLFEFISMVLGRF